MIRRGSPAAGHRLRASGVRALGRRPAVLAAGRASAGALELLAHRVIWSLIICALLLLTVVPRGWWARIGTRRNLIMLAAAAAVVSVNWGTYIWAVNHGHVVETSLGYYINPILSILVGVIFLRERMHLAAVDLRRAGRRGRGGADHRLRPAAVDRPRARRQLRASTE